MALTNSALFVFVKWLNEDCWDVLPLSDVCKSDDDDDVDNFIGKQRMVRFNDEQHPATILELGNRKDLEKSCKEEIEKLKGSQVEKGSDIRRRVPKRILDNEEENVKKSKKSENSDLPKRKKKVDSQQRLLDDLRKKIDWGESIDSDVCTCKYKEKYDAVMQKVSDLEEKNSYLKKELENYRNSSLMIDKIKDIHKQAKSLLKYSKRNTNSSYEDIIVADVKEPIAESSVHDAPIPTSSQLKSSSQIEIIKDSGVFIEKRKLDNICADASGDGKKLARNLLMSLYKKEELINHSVTGKQSNAFKHLNAENTKPAIDKVRLNAILNFVRNETSTDIAKVKCSIANKLKEVTKFYSKT